MSDNNPKNKVDNESAKNGPNNRAVDGHNSDSELDDVYIDAKHSAVSNKPDCTKPNDPDNKVDNKTNEADDSQVDKYSDVASGDEYNDIEEADEDIVVFRYGSEKIVYPLTCCDQLTLKQLQSFVAKLLKISKVVFKDIDGEIMTPQNFDKMLAQGKDIFVRGQLLHGGIPLPPIGSKMPSSEDVHTIENLKDIEDVSVLFEVSGIDGVFRKTERMGLALSTRIKNLLQIDCNQWKWYDMQGLAVDMRLGSAETVSTPKIYFPKEVDTSQNYLVIEVSCFHSSNNPLVVIDIIWRISKTQDPNNSMREKMSQRLKYDTYIEEE
jgi:hypothetical protein